MSLGHCDMTGLGTPVNVALPAVETPAAERPVMQRLAEVRRRQGLSRRTVARRLNIDMNRVREQEEETADVSLSVLYAWQKVLEVPLEELLVEAPDELAPPVLERAQLVRLMKTVKSIEEQAKQPSIRRMAQTMIGQLLEIMPELNEIGAWHTVGQRRRLDELGMAAQRRLSDDMFIERGD